MTKDPITQAADRHHAEEAERQRRYDAMVEEIYANLPAHLNEIVEFTDTEKALRIMLAAYLLPHNQRTRGWCNTLELLQAIDSVVDAAVKKIVERRLEL